MLKTEIIDTNILQINIVLSNYSETNLLNEINSCLERQISTKINAHKRLQLKENKNYPWQTKNVLFEKETCIRAPFITKDTETYRK